MPTAAPAEVTAMPVPAISEEPTPEAEPLRAESAPLIAEERTEPRLETVVTAPVTTETVTPVRPPSEPTVVVPPADRRPLSAARSRTLRHWQAFAVFMMLVALGFAGLIGVWRYAPDRLPPQLRPLEVLHMQAMPGTPARRPAPPESQFDE
jgi:hypothetical protein